MMTLKDKIIEADGIWQLQEQMEDPEKEGWINEQFTFVLTGDHATVYLLSEHPVSWKSEDDVYKLKAKWDGNTLFFLPPYGDWIPLAIYDNGSFYMKGHGQKRIFRRIGPEEVSVWTKDILKERDLFDYSLIDRNE